jgi:5'-nucleotidase
MSQDAPLIILTNDDGVLAPGLAALAEGLAGLGELMVVAPDRQRSAQSHAITLEHPLRASQLRPGWWSVDGTPVDCVYLALHSLAPRRVALLVSGINDGYNLGNDFYYSGTVAAAVEGTLREVPSIAASLQAGPHGGFAVAAGLVRDLAELVLSEGLPKNSLLNVNVPNRGPLAGYRWTRLGERRYRDQVEVRTDPRGRQYYWIGGPALDSPDGPDADGPAVQANLASISPVRLELTDQVLLRTVSGWRLGGQDPAPLPPWSE